jgi:hypothetical protein
MRSWIRDATLTLLLVSVFVWAGWKFYEDLNSQITHEGGEVIGEITFVENGAQRKFAGRALWGELEVSTPVYNYDSLRTIENSQAIVRLLDGTEISLAANTYIVLEWGEDSQNIEFLGGNISAAGSGTESNLQIKSEDTVIDLGDASVTLDKSEEEGINLSVDEGSVGVTFGGETTNVDENFKASISEELTVEQDAVKLKTPANNRLIVTTSAAVPMTFGWQQLTPLTGARLEIGEYKDFDNYSNFTIEDGADSISLNSLPGPYYWRISGKRPDGTSYHSPANRMVIIRDNAPGLQVPETDERFGYRTTLPDMAFSWEAASLSNGSRLQVSREPDFNTLVADVEGPDNFHTLSGLEQGTYYWRVQPRYTAADLIAYQKPEVRRFFIEKREEQAPPQLILPAAGEKINPLKTEDGLRFSWKSDREVGSYHILIASDPEMNRLLRDHWMSRNSYLLEELPPVGEYYWQVEGMDKENKPVPPSEIRPFSVMEAILDIDPVRPAPGSLSVTESFDNVSFDWESTLDGPYRTELFREGFNATPLLSKISKADNTTLVLPGPGRYFWQVSALDEDENIVLMSDQVSFAMEQRLFPPTITAPENESVFSLLGDRSLEISWLPVNDAEYYTAELTPLNSSFASLKMEATAGTSWSITDKRLLRAGSYTLRLRAHKALEDGGVNTSRDGVLAFTLDRVQDYGAARIIYPAQKQEISRLTIIDDRPSFRWTQTPVLPRQKLRLARDPNFRSLILDEELSVLTRPVPELETGTYYLQILSEDNEGNAAPASDIQAFTVSGIPPLPAVQLLQPAREEIIDMESRNNLLFSWVNQAGADYYRLALYPEDSERALFGEEKWTGSQYTINRLEDLDVGRFRFKIQAVREEDGDVFQESPVLELPFELTLPDITEIPDILSPEKQYAQ